MTDSYVPRRSEDGASSKTTNIIKPRLYDQLKWVTLIFIPAFVTFYISMSAVWGFPYVEQVSLTCTAIMTFFGALLQFSSKQFKNEPDGVLTLNTEGDYPTIRIQMDEIPDKEMLMLRLDTQ